MNIRGAKGLNPLHLPGLEASGGNSPTAADAPLSRWSFRLSKFTETYRDEVNQKLSVSIIFVPFSLTLILP